MFRNTVSEVDVGYSVALRDDTHDIAQMEYSIIIGDNLKYGEILKNKLNVYLK
jgi:hypothetical protein